MSKKLTRFVLIVAIFGIALVTIDFSPKTYSRPGGEIHIESFSWGVSNTQFVRICIGNGVGTQAGRDGPDDQFSISFVAISFEATVPVHRTQLQIPVSEFRCTDFSYQSLVAAGIVPQPNSALQFFITIGERSSGETVGAAERITVGAVQNIDVSTGEIKLYQPFRTTTTRQLTLIQDV